MCDICKNGIQKALVQEKELVKKYGWYVHAVMDDSKYPYSINVHTHGMMKKYGHFDLQICLPLPNDIYQAILSKLVNMIKNGKRFGVGEIYTVSENYPITFIDAFDDGSREVLRVILPDANGKVTENQIDEFHLGQYR